MAKYSVENAGNKKIAFSAISFDFETSDQVFATINTQNLLRYTLDLLSLHSTFTQFLSICFIYDILNPHFQQIQHSSVGKVASPPLGT